MGAVAERHYPWVGGMAAGGICYFLLTRAATLPPGTSAMLAALLNVAAIMVGFLVTAQTILISLDDKWIIQRSREAGAYRMLVDYMIAANYWWLLSAALCTVGMALVPAKIEEAPRPVADLLFAGWLFTVATAALSALRVITIFSVILRSISKPKR